MAVKNIKSILTYYNSKSAILLRCRKMQKLKIFEVTVAKNIRKAFTGVI